MGQYLSGDHHPPPLLARQESNSLRNSQTPTEFHYMWTRQCMLRLSSHIKFQSIDMWMYMPMCVWEGDLKTRFGSSLDYLFGKYFLLPSWDLSWVSRAFIYYISLQRSQALVEPRVVLISQSGLLGSPAPVHRGKHSLIRGQTEGLRAALMLSWILWE